MNGRLDWHSWARAVLENERPPGPEEDVEEFEQEVDEHGNFLRTAAALELDERFRAEASEAIEDLRFVGARLDDLWLFIPTTESEVTVLVDHLARPYTRAVRQHICLALLSSTHRVPIGRFMVLMLAAAQMEVAGASRDLVERGDYYAGTSANVLNRSKTDVSTLIDIIDDPNFGPARILLLERVRVTTHRPKFVQWQQDPQLAAEASRRLNRRTRK
ncbi:hypothetical protein [Solicola sp. PLA-1-18]|uniref:hypothetical protein n=1 Tax=Solicola sp. PLA-1-18 TaxID=3380532 RepID=UPI003B7AA6B7